MRCFCAFRRRPRRALWRGALLPLLSLLAAVGAAAQPAQVLRDLRPMQVALGADPRLGLCRLAEPAGFVWLCTSDAVLRYDGRTAQAFALGNRVPSDGPTALFRTRGGTLWAGTQRGELARLDAATGRFERFERWGAMGEGPPPPNDSRPGRPDLDAIQHAIQQIVEDRAGNLVLAGRVAGGLSRFDVATGRFSTVRLDTFALQPRAPVLLRAAPDGTVWALVVTGGLVRIATGRPAAFLRVPPGLTPRAPGPDGRRPPVVNALAVSAGRGGTVWVGIEGGVARLDAATGRFRPFVNPAAPSAPVTLLAERPDGQWWVGARGAGLFRFDPATGRFTRAAAAPSPSHLNVGPTLVDRAGRLWLSSLSDPLLVVDPSGAAVPLPEALRVPARDVMQDAQGRYYLFAPPLQQPSLMFFLDAPRAAAPFVRPPRERFERRLLRPSGQGRRTAPAARGGGVPLRPVAYAQDGPHPSAAAYASERDGLAADAPVPPSDTVRLVFSEARVPTRPDSVSRWVLAEAFPSEPLRLRPGERAFTARLSLLHAPPGPSMPHEIRLEGHDAAWHPLDPSFEVGYAGLAPGRYALLVRAWGRDSVVARLAVVAEAAPLERPLVRGLLTLGLGGTAAAGLVQWRRRRRRRLAQQKRLADDLHDRLGGRMSAVALLVEAHSHDPRLPGDVRERLGSAATVARGAVSDLRETVWLIDEENGSAHALGTRMEAVAHELLDGVPHRVRLTLDPDDGAVPSDVRRHVLLVAREALANALKHGSPPVEVDVRAGRDGVALRVQDHGTGFVPDTPTDGRGLRSMQARADEMDARLHVVSTPEGTVVRLHVPLA